MPYLEAAHSEQFHQHLLELIAESPGVKARLLLLRQVLEAIYKTLSEDSRISFNGLFARMQYVNEAISLPGEIAAQLHSLRILCNNAAHEADFKAEESAFYSGVYAIRQLLVYLNPEVSEAGLEEYLARHNAKPFGKLSPSRKASFNCVVNRFKPYMVDSEARGLELTVFDESGMECSILLQDEDAEGRRWSWLNKVLWKYSTLNCLNLTAIQGREHCYMGNPTTLIVVEPDFLIDASGVAECFCRQGMKPEYFVVKQLLKEAATEKLLQGTMVNGILDELIHTPQADYPSLFRKSLANQPISMVALGLESAMNIYDCVQHTHLPQIREFALSVQDCEVQLEPSFICPEYGLQGRLDVLYHQDGKPHIVELKSGSPPHYDIWIQHQMQVIAYNMIIRNCYQNASRGSSCILYSASPDNPLRHVVNTVLLEQNLLMCRNRIVGIMHNLAVNPEVFFNWLKQLPESSDTNFMQRNLQDIVTLLNSLEEHEYEWFLGQISLLVREIWSVKTGGLKVDSIYGHNALWQQSVTVKQQRYRIISELRISGIDFNCISCELSSAEQITDFRMNDIVVLYREAIPISNQEILRGVITDLDPTRIEITIRGGLSPKHELLGSENWAVEHDILESSLYSPLGSIFSFLRSTSAKRNLFLGLDKPEITSSIPPADDYLEEICNRMASAEQYYIVQGPPGTGKTSGLLTKYIGRLYNDSSMNILILSFTNRAVDEICLCLQREKIPFIRTGSSDEVSQELMGNLIQGKRYEEISQILKSNRIWVATVQSCNAWLNDLLKLIQIDELIVDEASQIVENAILGIISQARKTILIGDQNQLPPISLQANERFTFQHEKLKGLCYANYNQSLMERLSRVCNRNNWQHAFTMLNRHYRMHDQIAELVQRNYQGQLISMLERQKSALPVSSHPLLSKRLVWIECPPSAFSFYDPLQVDLIKSIIKLLEQHGEINDLERDIGIVAPFRAMIHALLHELESRHRLITIDTVERFQGSERRIIIITLPLKSAENLRNIQALSADGNIDRKLNVAVSRAEERLIILGNSDLCLRSAHYSFLIDKISASGIVLPNNQIFQRS